VRIGIDVHVLNGPPQGTASVWRNVLPHLPPKHEYWLYSFDPEVTARLLPGSNFVHRRIPLQQSHLRIQFVYPWLARRDRCDAFHVNYYGPWFGARGLVVTIHDLVYLDFPEYAPPARRWQMALLGRLSARAARQVTTDSEYWKRRITDRFGVPADRIAVVPPGLGREWSEPDRQAIATAWTRISARVPLRFVLTVGRLDPRKNLPLAARVTRVLRDLGLTDGLVVVGPEDFGGPAIRRAWAADGTADLVTHLTGLDTPELQALYAHAGCVLFLSQAEGFGMPPLEAMALGTPVVASNRTVMPEVCGDAASLVDPNNQDAVVSAARTVLSDEATRAGLVERGRSRVAMFTSERMARELMGVYESAGES
jgi:glycosyltransferase involved in cell wall biosynthesis